MTRLTTVFLTVHVALARLTSRGSGLRVETQSDVAHREHVWQMVGGSSANQLTGASRHFYNTHLYPGSSLLRKIGSLDNVLHADSDLFIFEHGTALLHKDLQGIHEELLGLGFAPHAVMAHQSIYRRGEPEAAPRDFAEAAIEMPDSSQMPNVNVCMTTIPSHLTTEKGFAAIVQSLQSVLEEQIYAGKITGYLTIPSKASTREGIGYSAEQAAKLVNLFNGKLVILPVDHDVGPASRYLGCAQVLKDPKELIVAFDDDIAYENHTISSLVCAKRHDPAFSWTGHKFYGLRGFQTGQGADGLLMSAGDLSGFPAFVEAVKEKCFKVDDLVISEYLTNYKRRPVKSLEDKEQDINACGLVKMPIYKSNCWMADTKGGGHRRICRPTVQSVNSLRNDHASGGRGDDMHRCSEALAAQQDV